MIIWDLFQVGKSHLIFKNLIKVIHHINKVKKKIIIVLIHAEKAWNKLNPFRKALNKLNKLLNKLNKLSMNKLNPGRKSMNKQNNNS